LVRFRIEGSGQVGRNGGRPVVAACVVGDILADATAQLVARHPGFAGSVVAEVTYQVATELVSVIAEAERFSLMLDRRAHARLMAMAGAPVAIGSPRSVRTQRLHDLSR
jgi:imidazolonepropionase-like amidohydrolase